MHSTRNLLVHKQILQPMKIPVVIIAIMIVIGSAITTAYAQTDNQFIIFVHINIRNSDGQLIAHQEGYKIQVLDLELLNKLLDKQPVVSTVQIGGQNYEIIQLTNHDKYYSPTVLSNQGIGIVVQGQPQFLVNYNHDGYVVDKGDVVTSVWTIIRPAH